MTRLLPQLTLLLTCAVAVIAATGEDLFPHWNVDSACTTASDRQPTTVQMIGGCSPPVVVVDRTTDCEANTFVLSVDVQSLGSATSVGLTWTVNGGTPGSLSGLPVGTYQIGPFMNLSLIDLVVEHAEEPACDVAFPDLTSPPCVIQDCGPNNYTLCYTSTASYMFTYQGDPGYPLRLKFNSGTLDQFGFGEVLTLYDGLDITAPVLYTGTGNLGDFTGIMVTSTNPDHAITFVLTTNDLNSCDVGVGVELDYTVGCLDCEPATAIAGDVITDCGTQGFTVEVEVTDMGSSDSLLIANDAGLPASVIYEPGTGTAGPFPVGTPVTLTVVNEGSTICNVGLGTFENSFCAIQISCGAPAFEDSYCYTNSDVQSWLYENTGTDPVALLFTSGSIESDTWDHASIYDGTDNTGDVLWTHDGNFTTENLAGLLVISTGPAIYMEMSSDEVISCSEGFGQIEEWAWTVGCLDCEQPAASYEVVLDCENSGFYIRTTIDSLGTDTSVTITNTGGAPVIEVTEAGSYDSGPFALGTIVSVDVVSDENNLCSVGSAPLTNAPCPLIGCGPFQFEYCYPNEMDTTIVYQGEGTNPIALLFNSGEVVGFDDYIEVYNGPDYQAPLMYTGMGNNGDLSGLLFTSSNPANALCVRFVSDFFDSCDDNGGTSPWDWTVSCLDCTNPEVDFEVVEDCLHHSFNIVANVTGLGTASDLRIIDSWSGDTLSGIGLGTTVIGPIPVNTPAHLTVLNSSNPLCRIIGPDLTYTADDCVVTTCEMLTQEHCYANGDTAWFVYQSEDNVPMTVSFSAGQLLDGDEVWIYNGLDQTAQLVFVGDLGGDLTGLALSSSNPDNALTILFLSDPAGSCATGEASPALLWTVGCGLVGEASPEAVGFGVFPNPASEELFIRLPAGGEGAVRVEFMDLTGRLVLARRVRAKGDAPVVVNLADLSNGRYALRLTDAHGSATVSVQVAH